MEKMKSIAGSILGILFVILIGIILAFFVRGAAWASEKSLPILNDVGAVSLLALILIGLPLSFLRKTMAFSGGAFIYWSYLCGVCLWMTSLLVTMNLWGYIAAMIGLFLAGVGVFPVACLACIFKGEWAIFSQLILQFVILLTARFYGIYVAGKSERTNITSATS